MKTIKTTTGHIIIDNYDGKPLETLSIADYGKNNNVKADFLGLTNEIHGVPQDAKLLPLQEKWVITMSTQSGCPQKCKFCDCPNVPFKGNATVDDLQKQLGNALQLHPEVKYTERLNIHFARMGEPTYNFQNIFDFSRRLILNKEDLVKNYGLAAEVIHPVFTTMMPRNVPNMEKILKEWCMIKNANYHGQAGLQLSINSTCNKQRREMFNVGEGVYDIEEIAQIAGKLPMPLGRKYCLNFALASGYEVDAEKLFMLFNPNKFMVKITPIHENNACKENGIETKTGYSSYSPYKKAEEDLKMFGFDVLVFVPHTDEEKSTITCGNAILGGSKIITD